MKAILINDDRTLSWADVPDAVPGDDEVLVEVAYAGVNRADVMQRAGNYPPPEGCPPWMGLEIAGTIRALGPAARQRCPYREGDTVCALLGGGGYAQYAAVRWDMLLPVPDGYTLAEAAGLPEVYCTAYLNLFYEGLAKSGETLLMAAGASGLASAVIPLAKSYGLRVLTTVRRDAQVAAIAYLGADRIINTRTENLADVLREELDAGTPVNLAIDCIGGEEMGACLPYLAHGGRWIMIAALGGNLTTVDLKNLYVRGIRLIGSTLRSRPPAFKADLIARVARDVFPKLKSELPRMALKTLPITRAADAHELLTRGGNVGKVVLQVKGEE